MSTTAATAAPVTAVAMSTAGTGATAVALVKVGSGSYTDLPIRWEELERMRKGALLERLTGSRVFSGYFADVKIIGECTVAILKGALPDGQRLPAAADEAPGKVVELEAAMTVAEAVAAGGCTDKPLFIHVRLPSGLSALEAGE